MAWVTLGISAPDEARPPTSVPKPSSPSSPRNSIVSKEVVPPQMCSALCSFDVGPTGVSSAQAACETAIIAVITRATVNTNSILLTLSCTSFPKFSMQQDAPASIVAFYLLSFGRQHNFGGETTASPKGSISIHLLMYLVRDMFFLRIEWRD